LEARKARFIF